MSRASAVVFLIRASGLWGIDNPGLLKDLRRL